MKKVEHLEEVLERLPRMELYPDHPTGFTLRYSASKGYWTAGFSRTADGIYAFSGQTPVEAVQNFLSGFNFSYEKKHV